MSFDIASTPEIFQNRNQMLFGDIEGIEIYFDSIIIAIMFKVLEKVKSLNIKFNLD